MTWTKLGDEMPDRPTIWLLSHGAFRLHVSGLAYSNRMLLEGVVPAQRVPALVPHYRPAYLDELLAGGIWARDGHDLRILDSADDQLTRADVLALREKRAAAGRLGGLVSGKARRRGTANGVANTEASASASASSKREANGNPGPVPGLRGHESPVHLSVLPRKRRAASIAGLSLAEFDELTRDVSATDIAVVLRPFGVPTAAELDDGQRHAAAVRMGLASG